MDLTKWGAVADLVASPVGTLILAFFVWKMAGEMKELKSTIHDNGFLKRSDMDQAWGKANEIHKRQDEHLARLDGDVARLETNERDIWGHLNRMKEAR